MLYMQHRNKGQTQTLSAAKAGMSTRTARRLDQAPPDTTPHVRPWRTRHDPLSSVWDSELLPLLQDKPELSGLTLWEYLDDKYPGEYPSCLLRTIQRRVKFFRATQGNAKEAIFRQDVPFGRMGLSDFSHPNDAITLRKEPFAHLLYQFRLASSGWRYAQVIQGGESYSALADGLQNAFSRLGGCPIEHRTDSLSAAFNNASEQEELTRNYKALCEHYGIEASRNNKGVSHENGAIETAHRSLKHRISQGLRLRGSSDFQSIKEYQQFIERCIARLNEQTRNLWQEEMTHLQPLPNSRFMDYTVHSVKVTRSSTIDIKRVTYSVPSRLIGSTLCAHLSHDTLRLYLAQTEVLCLPRVYASKKMRARRIDYRHVINSLAAKPQAFRFSVLRDDLLPNDDYKELWAIVDQQLQSREACKWIVGVLKIASTHTTPDLFGKTLLGQGRNQTLPSLQQLHSQYLPTETQQMEVSQHSLDSYDQFITGAYQQDRRNHELCN
nr:IS21 family transposase [Chrysiogenes arsenatis]